MIFKNNYIRNIILLIFFILVQKTLIWILSISVYNITPDFIMIAIIYIGIKEGRINGCIYGFFAGIIFDFLTGTFIGLSALTYTITGFISGLFYDENERFLRKYFFVLMVFGFSVIGFSVYYYIYFQGTPINFSRVFLTYILTTAAYTSVISMIYIFIPKKRGIERTFLSES